MAMQGPLEPLGPMVDVASGMVSAVRGDWWGAGTSLLAAVPVVGGLANAGKVGRGPGLPAPTSMVTGPGSTAAAQLTGQMHHGISRTIHKALEQHPNLKGLYSARDPRFVTQAKDLQSHRGYDSFHRRLDAEISGWIRDNPRATTQQFESYLRDVYRRPDVATRFPDGL
jgi:hypothetical protein